MPAVLAYQGRPIHDHIQDNFKRRRCNSLETEVFLFRPLVPQGVLAWRRCTVAELLRRLQHTLRDLSVLHRRRFPHGSERGRPGRRLSRPVPRHRPDRIFCIGRLKRPPPPRHRQIGLVAAHQPDSPPRRPRLVYLAPPPFRRRQQIWPWGLLFFFYPERVDEKHKKTLPGQGLNKGKKIY